MASKYEQIWQALIEHGQVKMNKETFIAEGGSISAMRSYLFQQHALLKRAFTEMGMDSRESLRMEELNGELVLSRRVSSTPTPVFSIIVGNKED